MAGYTTSMLVVLSALVVIIGYHYGEAVQCYVCNSGSIYDGNKCKDIKPKDAAYNSLLKNCTEEGHKETPALDFVRCRTMIQDVEGDVRVVRSCATWPDKGKANRCMDRTGTSKIKIHYCECEGDMCNSAVTLCSSALALVLAVFVGHANL